jgi:hypothetical protein
MNRHNPTAEGAGSSPFEARSRNRRGLIPDRGSNVEAKIGKVEINNL